MSPTPTRPERRAHYDWFVAEITDLCHDNGVRADLRTGRGRPVQQCPRLDRYLHSRIRGFGAKRPHYTIAALIALTRPEPPDAAAMPEAPPAPDAPSTQGADPDSGATSAKAPQPDTAPASPEPEPDAEQAAAAWRARPTLGTTLALAIRHHGLHRDRTEQRLYTLAKLGSDLLQPRLPGLTEHLLQAGARPDYAVLLEDLTWWDADRERITARWRETFYLTLDRTELTTDTEL
jgi:CRISPR type I-E-associated protein CasB/Cse2